MKSIALVVLPILLMCLFTPPAVFCDPPPSADEKAEADVRLNAVLNEWAKASDAVHQSHFRIRVSERDEITEMITPSAIEVFIRKPDLMRIDYKNDKSGRIWLVYNDRLIRVWSSTDKTVRCYPLSDNFGFPEHPERYPNGFFSSIGGGILEGCSWLAAGLPVGDLKTRFDLRLSKEDENYIYLEIKPRSKKDKLEFNRMRVVLYQKTYQVRQLWLELGNSTAMTYDYEPPDKKSAESITPESILKGLPTDYKKLSFDP